MAERENMNIALIAHDNRKELMVQFCTAYAGILSRHTLCATNTTGKIISDATGLEIRLFMNGAQGGDEQIGARIAYNEIDLVLYFHDPECTECMLLKDKVIQSPVLQDERVKVVRIYPEDDANVWTKADHNLPATWTDGRVIGGALASHRLYWFPQMPSFYLLDINKRVVLKDVTLDQLEQKLQEILQ